MKRWTVLLLALTLVLSLSLAACGSKNDPTNAQTPGEGANPTAPAEGNSPEETPGNEEVSDAGSLPTAEELIAKTTEASQSLKSYSLDSNVDQNIVVSQGTDKQEQAIQMTMKTDYVADPLAIAQVIKMTAPGMEGQQEMKQYITPEGIFMHVEGQWMQMPGEMKDQLMEQIQSQSNPQAQLEQFKSIMKDTSVEEQGSNYILKAEVSGDNVKDLVKEIMSNSGAGADPQAAAMVDHMNIKLMKMDYVISKADYQPVSLNLEMVLEMEQEGMKMSMEMKMDSTFSNFNAVPEIKVPEEALNSAVAPGM